MVSLLVNLVGTGWPAGWVDADEGEGEDVTPSGGTGEEDMGEEVALVLEDRIGGRGADLMEEEDERGRVWCWWTVASGWEWG
ncbi:hypothetical protein pipiens_015431 [Culex pipiens pipiens]|uniref:Uncharacterized protein n=1 Tax=Culex pipiens pipiens TaxID=38569 RepID=A0ABD1CQI7_CULPP